LSLARRALLIGLAFALVKATEFAHQASVRILPGEGPPASPELAVVGRISQQLRRVLANVLWMRVETYMHQGTAFKVLDIKGGDRAEPAYGVHYTATGELIPVCKLIVLLDPAFIQAGTLLGIYKLLGEDKRQEAIDFFQYLVSANPDHPRLYQLFGELGRGLWQKQFPALAIQFLRRAVAFFPRVDDERLLLRYGEPPRDRSDDLWNTMYTTALVDSLIRQEKYEEAITHWKTLGWSNPVNPNFRVLVAYRRMKQTGKYDVDELAIEMRRYRKEEKDYLGELDRTSPGTKLPMPKPDPQKAKKSMSPPKDYKKEPKIQKVGLGGGGFLRIKVIALALLAGAIGVAGLRRGWLRA
jgi:tetratricopeptide (TPR) repeat protein